MALRYERRHLTYRTWFHKRPTGKGSGTPPPPQEFCLILISDTGDDSKTLQLIADPGTDDHCVELITSDT
jgi:hypothetical protein